jgi:hypothetical protein
LAIAKLLAVLMAIAYGHALKHFYPIFSLAENPIIFAVRNSGVP